MPIKNNIVLKTVTRGLLPVMVLFGLYVLVHGKVSPGGGFQAGVIVAAAFMLYALVFGRQALCKIWPMAWMRMGACAGVLLYAGVGLLGLLVDGHYLDYDGFGATGQEGQFIGIFLVEFGVGITVFSVVLWLFCLFTERAGGEE